MPGFSATCDRCGQLLIDVDAKCPNCGDAPKTVHMEARTQVSAAANARMTRRKFEQELKKNWSLIVVLVALDLFSMIPAYFLSGWQSVVVSLLFVVLSTAIGYYAITRVITITVDDGR